MIQQPTGTKQMTLKIDCYVKMKVYSNDFSRWTLTMRVIEKKGRWVSEKSYSQKYSHLVTKLQITHPPHRSFFLSLPRFCLALSFTQSHKWPHTHSNSLTSAVLSAKSPDSLSRLWKQLKCYVWEER